MLRKKQKADCPRNFDLEALILKNNWATVDEMESVVLFHLRLFQSIVTKCKSILPAPLNTSDLTFATRFDTIFLILNVKCSRLMTFQRLQGRRTSMLSGTVIKGHFGAIMFAAC